jgi:VanZ family protein
MGPLLGVYWLCIFTATHSPQATLPQTHLGDKAEHFIAYGLLALLMTAWLRYTRPQLRGATWIVLAVCVAYAAIDETTQPIVNRFADMRDFLADAIGASVGTLIGMVLFRSRKPTARQHG